MRANGLELVRDFVNTLDPDTGEDGLATPALLAAWLSEHGLAGLDRPVSGAAVRRALELREAIRDELLANAGGAPPGVSRAALERQAARSRAVLGFGPHGPELRPAAGGVDGALGALLAIVARSMTEGTWGRLKACRADDCRWAFLDRSRNGSRHWCSMQVCGNREKVRAFRAREARQPIT